MRSSHVRVRPSLSRPAQSSRTAVPDFPAYDLAQPVRFRHPVTNEQFLSLTANDYTPAGTFGLNYMIALSACEIVAFNQSGFISTSRDCNDAEACISGTSDPFLSPSSYYYYHTPAPDFNICTDFHEWEFPHNSLHDEWKSKPSIPFSPISHHDADNWTIISSRIKIRDAQCRISSWTEEIETAHIVKRDFETWLLDNDMEPYLHPAHEKLNESEQNLFALRADLHSMFDKAKLVMVPKHGPNNPLSIQFLTRTSQAGLLYHNTAFSDRNLSREFLFARFAWAVIQHASKKNPRLHPRAHGVSKRIDIDVRDAAPDGGDRDSAKNLRRSERNKGKDKGEGAGKDRAGKGKRKRKSRAIATVSIEVCAAGQEGGEYAGGSTDDEGELARDLDIARRRYPFFLKETTQSPSNLACYYDMEWYPGMGKIRRLRKQWLESHPNIRARNDASAWSDMAKEDAGPSDIEQ